MTREAAQVLASERADVQIAAERLPGRAAHDPMRGPVRGRTRAAFDDGWDIAGRVSAAQDDRAR